MFPFCFAIFRPFLVRKLDVQVITIHIYIYGSPPPGTYLFQFYTLFTVFKASPVKGFEGTGIPYSL